MQRRKFLAACGTSAVFLAGCTGETDDEDSGNGSGDGNGEESDNADSNGDDESEEAEGESGEETGNGEYVDEADETVELSYGDEAETSFGVVYVAHGLDIQDSFERSSGRDEEAGDGMQFALLNFEARNESDTPQRVALPTDPVLLHDGSQYDTQIGLPERYEGGELQPDVTREGQLLYEVPEGTGEEELTTVLSRDSYDGDSNPYQFTVHWQG